LLWRDDGSTDATVALLDEFALAHRGRVVRMAGGARLGAAASFMVLLAAAPAADAYAFMDQDDVWLPGRLARAVELLGQGNELSCGRLRLVDAALRPLGCTTMPGRAPGFASLLAHNVVAGCTMALSPQGRRQALAAPMPEGSLHDWWCALLVTGSGGRLAFAKEPQVLYRQHGGNLVGGRSGLAARARGALARGGAAFRRQLARHLNALHAAPLMPEARRVVATLQGLPSAGPLGRLRLRRQAGLRHHDALGDVLLTLWLLRW
jgi:glycosyltransferase involved in cell wall biosynthesis